MAKGNSKKAVIIEVVDTVQEPAVKGFVSFEFKGVKITVQSGVKLDKEEIKKLAGDKLRKLKVDLSDFMAAYLKSVKKK